jgi:catechol 2,3-dioxygenase-like lactoylglutathione lyase family enzyme
MSLRDAPLLYVFFETASLEQQRALCEQVLGLPVIENQFHPPHEYHGLVKYDAGQIILSLNLAREMRFQKEASDALTTVLAVDSAAEVAERLRGAGYTAPAEPGGLFTDRYGHHYIIRDAAPLARDQPLPAVQELRLTVRDLPASVAFYADTLGLELREQEAGQARFATGTADLLLQAGETAPDGREVRYSAYLIVFYTRNIQEVYDSLGRRGLRFTSQRVGYSDIGATARFVDPSGHVFCLYEPSEESLTWGSGAKVRALTALHPIR